MKVYKPKILSNGSIAGYVKGKNGKLVWRILSGPKHKGGFSYEDINETLTANVSFMNLFEIIKAFKDYHSRCAKHIGNTGYGC